MRYKEHIGAIKYDTDTTNNAKQEKEIIQIQANGPLLDIKDKNNIYKQYKNGNIANAQKITTPNILFDLVIEKENHRDCTYVVGKPTRNGDDRTAMYIQENQNTAG
jgi:predicted transcriptional regulator YdeE